jgi:hypothetical protein
MGGEGGGGLGSAGRSRLDQGQKKTFSPLRFGCLCFWIVDRDLLN